MVEQYSKDKIVDTKINVNRTLSIKEILEKYSVHVISAYAPQVDLDNDVKRHF